MTMTAVANLLQIMTGNVREQVVLNLQVKSAHEPANERVTVNISGRRHLKRHEMWPLVEFVHGHAWGTSADAMAGVIHEHKHNGA